MLLRARLFVLSAVVVAPALVACEASSAGEGEGEEGEGEGGCTAADLPSCTEGELVNDCRDDVFNTLSMNLTTAAPGRIDNVAEAGGTFEVSVDATAGGFNGSGGWVYGKFTDDGLVKVELLDDASFDSLDWDIAFRRFIVRLNSGYAGPGCVSAANVGANTAFEEVGCAPDGAIFHVEDTFLSDSDSCTVVPDGSGLESPGVVLQNWWEYPGCVATTGNVYIIHTGDDRLIKFTMTQFYEGGQDVCNETGSAEGTSAKLKLRYGYLD